jgi:TrmH family RNA methyltransferase
VVIEGIKPINELSEILNPRVVLTYDLALVPARWSKAELIEVTEPVMQKVSGMIHPEGLLAEVEMPASSNLAGLKYIIAFDGVSDPGNLGTLLRSALALGWEGAFLLNDCCDPYNEKVLRAARGANFKLPIREGSWSDLKKIISDNTLLPLVADLKGDSLDKLKVDSSKAVLLLLCNEAHGPSQEALSLCQRISIPISKKMESLNVASAGAILMYLIRNR